MIAGERTLRDMLPSELGPGQYMRWYVDAKWYAVPPGGSLPITLELATHEVEEHQDRTVTVSGLIGGWRLIRGVWSEA